MPLFLLPLLAPVFQMLETYFPLILFVPIYTLNTNDTWPAYLRTADWKAIQHSFSAVVETATWEGTSAGVQAARQTVQQAFGGMPPLFLEGVWEVLADAYYGPHMPWLIGYAALHAFISTAGEVSVAHWIRCSFAAVGTLLPFPFLLGRGKTTPQSVPFLVALGFKAASSVEAVLRHISAERRTRALEQRMAQLEKDCAFNAIQARELELRVALLEKGAAQLGQLEVVEDPGISASTEKALPAEVMVPTSPFKKVVPSAQPKSIVPTAPLKIVVPTTPLKKVDKGVDDLGRVDRSLEKGRSSSHESPDSQDSIDAHNVHHSRRSSDALPPPSPVVSLPGASDRPPRLSIDQNAMHIPALDVGLTSHLFPSSSGPSADSDTPSEPPLSQWRPNTTDEPRSPTLSAVSDEYFGGRRRIPRSAALRGIQRRRATDTRKRGASEEAED